MHTVIVVDAQAQPLRVACDYCRSEHNYRGGPRMTAHAPSPSAAAPRHVAQAVTETLPLVSQRESISATVPAEQRHAPPMTSTTDIADLELLIRRIIREETGLTGVAPAEKWRGGELVLRPGKPGLLEKSWPIESFFHKVVMLRNRLRTLEQQVNASDLPDDQKLKLQSYVTGCYGSLTSFNVLFADEDDRFVGSAGD